ncbi:hypothetical protein FT663_00319 [Candidozyma haemuli var. vulneris]|uniref:Major facilitator superfamily (MFS) profile domain-containing protein n=1 Tax=Candidozyma haemuli TaxID=45357 RepID=A0A2V1ARU6_9ASCO|nr:hypothetical protein CXQ85_002031 [[Candida] haemuloni]KAF3992992.1 hypothetical protein FT662_00815 [[Candida] haemuloni var. vulneris]KAF3995572.1 hypothetical protein FT663_00319 [[Candida] haemuloni var. vulneris]PVH20246.1 hypothetical protein CXQ85_002031 [[Candida] haemuloni]
MLTTDPDTSKHLSADMESAKHQQKPKRKFRWRVEDHDSPKEIYNKALYLSVMVFGILGAARGLDEGNIGSNISLPSFRERFGFNDPTKSEGEIADLKSNIASMVQLGCVGGALLAVVTVDRLGRVNALRQVCVLWAIGVIIQITSSNVGQLYAGRIIEGLAVGQTTTIGPTYLAEVAPKQIRGLCGCIFAGAVYLGVMLSCFANYGTALHISGSSQKQWIIPTSLKIIFAGGLLILTFLFCIESPRWLMKVGRHEKAYEALCKLRALPKDHPLIIGEINDINEQLLMEKEAQEGNSALLIVKEFVRVKANRYRLLVIAIPAQLLGQWSGSNAVTVYAPELFGVIGVHGVETLKMTAIAGVVKFISAYLGAFFIIDALGRKTSMYVGITLQFICELYYAIFLNIVPDIEDSLEGSKKRASQGAVAAIFLSGTGWVIGFNALQYLMGSEIFPLRIRSVANSLVMVLHFANQYGNSKALPEMMIAMKPYGAFYFFSGVLVISLFWVWFFVPEVAGRSLESIDDIFNLPWHQIGRNGPKLCPDFSETSRMHFDNGMMVYDDKAGSEHNVENASSGRREDDEESLKDPKKEEEIH